MNREAMLMPAIGQTEVTTCWSDGERLRTDRFGRTRVLADEAPIRLCIACWEERAAAIAGGRKGLLTCEHVETVTTTPEEVVEL